MTETARFTLAAIAAPHRAAAEAGRDVLALGGHALEAAVAAAATLAVALPARAGLGADATLLVREPGGRMHVIDATGKAGLGATAESYRAAGHHDMPARGAKAALTIPGAVAGWHLALEMAQAFGGRMPLADLLAPAIKLAREGCAGAGKPPRDLEDLTALPGFAATFLEDGKWPDAGKTHRREAVADTLEQLAHASFRDFYRGDVGRELAADLARMGSPLQRKDLETFEARVRKPLSMRLGFETLHSAPAPTFGLAHLLAAGLRARIENSWRHEERMLHALGESAKHALQIAEPFAIDPAQLEQRPEGWLDTKVFEREESLIAKDRAKPLAFTLSRPQALHVSVVDAKGYAVSCTISMGDDFGAGCIAARTGVLLNNAGRFFSLDPRAPHVLAPGRKPPKAASPLMSVHDEGRVLALGSGRTEIDNQILARLQTGSGLAEALEAPRLRLAQGMRLPMEDRFDPSTLRALEKLGHEIACETPGADEFGTASAVLRHRDGSVAAAIDPRCDGAVEGF